MKDIENRVEIGASPRTVFKAISDPEGVYRYVPGVRGATMLAQGLNGVGTLVDLTTRHHRHLEAVVTAETKNHYFALQDSRGTVLEWELRATPHGTLAIERIHGDFGDRETSRIEAEARAKIFRLKAEIEGARRRT